MENASFTVFKTILLYATFILAAPITTFFVSKFFFFEGKLLVKVNHISNKYIVLVIVGASDITSNVWSAVLAVIMLHIALGLYIYKAYYEAEKVKPLEKTDQYYFELIAVFYSIETVIII